jgi:hypothetical protein
MAAITDWLIEKIIRDEDYDIRKDGRIFFKFLKNCDSPEAWREVNSTGSNGYRRIIKTIAGKRYEVLCHRVIYRKFNGKLDMDLIVNHIDGNRQNNNCKNLELITVAENNVHSKEILGNPKVTNSKINYKTAEKIRSKIKSGSTRAAMSDKYKLSVGTISLIVNRKTWNTEDGGCAAA